jgi:hypothetical protein
MRDLVLNFIGYKLLWVVVPMFFGFLAFATRNRIPKNIVKTICEFLFYAMMLVLLPLHLFSSAISSTAWSSSKVGALLFLGCLMYLIVLMALSAGEYWLSKKAPFPEATYLYSSFGGGNRGILLLIPFAFVCSMPGQKFLPGIHIPNNQLIDYFAVIDMGYFIPYLCVLMMRSNGPNSSPITGSERNELRRLMLLCAWIIFSILSGVFLHQFLSEGAIAACLNELRPNLSKTMAFTSAIYIGLKAVKPDPSQSEPDLSGHVLAFFISRSFGLAFCWGALGAMDYVFTFDRATYWGILLSLIAMAVLPPSSMVDKFVKLSPALNDTHKSNISYYAGVANWIFVLLLTAIWVIALVLTPLVESEVF